MSIDQLGMDENVVDPLLQDGTSLGNEFGSELGLRLEEANTLVRDDGDDGPRFFNVKTIVQPLEVIVTTPDGR
jgi:hypothetical protein